MSNEKARQDSISPVKNRWKATDPYDYVTCEARPNYS